MGEAALNQLKNQVFGRLQILYFHIEGLKLKTSFFSTKFNIFRQYTCISHSKSIFKGKSSLNSKLLNSENIFFKAKNSNSRILQKFLFFLTRTKKYLTHGKKCRKQIQKFKDDFILSKHTGAKKNMLKGNFVVMTGHWH